MNSSKPFPMEKLLALQVTTNTTITMLFSVMLLLSVLKLQVLS